MQTFHMFYEWKERNWIKIKLALSRDLDGIIGSGQNQCILCTLCYIN